MNETPKNREWVKNAAIVFLAVLLVLTFFSNTIMNRSLPEVATQDVTDGAIVSKVRGSGTVTANGNNQVKMEKTRVIRAVLVKSGQEVKAGDVLFTLGEGSSEEIEALEEKIRNLQNSYNRTAVGGTVYSYAADERNLDVLADKLLDAEVALQYAEEAARKATSQEEQILAVEKELAEAIPARDEAKKAYDDAKQRKGQDDKKLQEYLEQQARIIEGLINNQEYGNMIDGDLLDGTYDNRSIITIQISRDESELASASITASPSPSPTSSAATTTSGTPAAAGTSGTSTATGTSEASAAAANTSETPAATTTSEVPAAVTTTTEAPAAVTTTTEAPVAATTTSEAPAAATSEASEAPKTLAASTSPEMATTQQNSETPEKTVSLSNELPSNDNTQLTKNSEGEDPAEEEQKEQISSPVTGDEDLSTIEGELVVLRQALQDYDHIQSEIYLLKTDAEVEATKEVYDEAAEKVNSLSKTLETLLTTGSAEGAVYKARLDAYNQAEIAYLNALDSLDAKRANDYQAQAAKGIDLNATMQELEVAKAKLAELTGTDGENITAKVAGTVTSVECNAGDKKMKDDVLCTIEVPDQGYTLSFTATNEQASRLRIGDQATVSNFYWGNEVTATLSSIKTDPKNPQNNKLLTFDLEGNVTSGSQLTISVGSKSANYDLIIPSSAIRSDSNGSFVLKVEAKNSPLGNRYIAKRVPVEVLASDDNNSAVTAELQYGDYVITTSSAPIKNGSMVRLANAS